MKLEDQICSLDQAKRLHELGIKGPHLHSLGFPLETYPAYTVAEFGAMLDRHYWICVPYSINEWRAAAYGGHIADEFDERPLIQACYADTEAEARAALLIYLLENKLVTVDEVNKRLNHDH